MQPEGTHDRSLSEDSGKVRDGREGALRKERAEEYRRRRLQGNGDSAASAIQMPDRPANRQILPKCSEFSWPALQNQPVFEMLTLVGAFCRRMLVASWMKLPVLGGSRIVGWDKWLISRTGPPCVGFTTVGRRSRCSLIPPFVTG